MKKILSFFLVAIFTIYVVKAENWDGNSQTTEWYESNTSPYSISTAEELAGLSHLVKSGTSFEGEEIILANDIDLNGQQWFPIGYYTDAGNRRSSFRGIFKTDGEVKTIRNFIIDGYEIFKSVQGMRSFGLFGFLGDGAEIHNIAIEDGRITAYSNSTHYYAGGLVGYAESKSEGYEGIKIINCSNISVEISAENGGNAEDLYIGGLIGYSKREANSISIMNCKNETAIRGFEALNKVFIGGIIGLNGNGSGNFHMKNCVNTGEISGTAIKNIAIGGIIGSFRDSEFNSSFIENCHNTASIGSFGASSYSYTGGLIGEFSCKNRVEISRCTNTGNIEATGNYLNTGGLIGKMTGYAYMDIHISVSFNNADITANSEINSYTGGIIGHALCGNNDTGNGSIHIENAYSNSNIYSYSADKELYGYVGGLCGSMQIAKQQPGNTVIFENCYATGTFDGEIRYASGIAGQFETEDSSTSRIANCIAYYTSEFNAKKQVNRISNSLPEMEYNYANIPGNNWSNDTSRKDGGYWSGKMSKRPFFDESGSPVWNDYIWTIDLENAAIMPKFKTGLFDGLLTEQKDVNAPGMPDLNNTDRATYNPAAMDDIIYTGQKYVMHDPVNVTYDTHNPLILDTDYTISEDNDWTNAGEHALVFTAIAEGDYVGSYSIPFKIKPKDISDDVNVPLNYLSTDMDRIYNGEEQNPILEQVILTYNGMNLAVGQDYTIEYRNNINAGTAEIVVKGKGNYEGERIVNFTISQKEISDPSVVITNIPAQYFNGLAITPVVTLHDGTTLLEENTDYKLEYSNNTTIGTGVINISGMNNYRGTTSVEFQIVSRPADPDPEPNYYTVSIDVIGEGTVDVSGLINNRAKDGDILSVNTNPANNYSFGSIFIQTGNEDEYEIGNGGQFTLSGNTTITVVFYRDDYDPNPDIDPTHNTEIDSGNIWASYGNLHIQANQPQYVRVISIHGKMVVSRSVSIGETVLPLPRGIYIVVLKNQKAIKINIQ